MAEETTFRKALEDLINLYSMENGSDTPDFILAEYLKDSLEAFDKAVNLREAWYGRGKDLAAQDPLTGETMLLPRPEDISIEEK